MDFTLVFVGNVDSLIQHLMNFDPWALVSFLSIGNVEVLQLIIGFVFVVGSYIKSTMNYCHRNLANTLYFHMNNHFQKMVWLSK